MNNRRIRQGRAGVGVIGIGTYKNIPGNNSLFKTYKNTPGNNYEFNPSRNMSGNNSLFEVYNRILLVFIFYGVLLIKNLQVTISVLNLLW